ncbi:hypothetical protein CK203_059347 [Vitis vinifera]|uniref:Uncharacterized protein n=1 Tax=Vitis vinifera TaxID=29760 RepID=A0A438GBK3_VITVI|nr:hypothetical protein CK203_059347 [Vitis vinifera]
MRIFSFKLLHQDFSHGIRAEVQLAISVYIKKLKIINSSFLSQSCLQNMATFIHSSNQQIGVTPTASATTNVLHQDDTQLALFLTHTRNNELDNWPPNFSCGMVRLRENLLCIIKSKDNATPVGVSDNSKKVTVNDGVHSLVKDDY